MGVGGAARGAVGAAGARGGAKNGRPPQGCSGPCRFRRGPFPAGVGGVGISACYGGSLSPSRGGQSAERYDRACRSTRPEHPRLGDSTQAKEHHLTRRTRVARQWITSFSRQFGFDDIPIVRVPVSVPCRVGTVAKASRFGDRPGGVTREVGESLSHLRPAEECSDPFGGRKRCGGAGMFLAPPVAPYPSPHAPPLHSWLSLDHFSFLACRARSPDRFDAVLGPSVRGRNCVGSR
jgi:hypothetical protein